VTALGEAWSSVRALQFKLGEMESNPALVQIVPPNELVVVIGFEVKIGGRAGTMSLCIPFKAIEPLVGELSAESWAAPPARPGGPWEARLNRHLVDVPVEVSGILCRSRITMGELRRLEVGDLISTEHPATAPAVLAVSGRPKHHAAIGRFQGNVALRILRPASTADRPA
jgi:flagellar motor switch protein FliM